MKRTIWTREENSRKVNHVSKHEQPKKTGLKNCKLRWANNLTPDVNKGSFTPQEEELVIILHGTIGSRWSIIAQQLPGKTDTDVKQYWNTRLKRKLLDMGIDPVTHKPFSQIIEDYDNMGGLYRSARKIASFNRDLRNAVLNHAVVSDKAAYRSFVMEEIVDVYEDGKRKFKEDTQTQMATSSSSSCSTSCCSWREYLIEEELLPVEAETERRHLDALVMENEEILMSQRIQDTVKIPNEKGLQSLSSSDSSFVDALLNGERDGFLCFPYLEDLIY